MKCDIVYKQSAKNLYRWKTNGATRHEPNLDLTKYEQTKYVLRKKSQYWKTLPSTGTVYYQDWGQTEGRTTYECSSIRNDNVQVFNIFSNERYKLSGVHSIYFGDNCSGKTILINVHGTGKVKVDAAAMFFDDKKGYGPGGFSTCMTSSILWNFPDADTVDIGNGKTSEFQGSLLVTGDMIMSTSGQSGRTMVLGDINHDGGQGSEFHSYEFNPPTPLPDPDDICVLPDDFLANSAIPAYPTALPTPPPTLPPTSGCSSIPQNNLPNGLWEIGNKNSCKKCEPDRPGGPVTWWPCNLNPPLCEGNCKFV